MTTAAGKHARQDEPEGLLKIGERQRVQDVARSEMECIRHKARDPLAAGFGIVTVEGRLGWGEMLAWFLKHTQSPDPRVSEVMATVKRVSLIRRYEKEKSGAMVDAWHVEAANERGVIFRDVIPTPRFFASWQVIEASDTKERDHHGDDE
jgi:hypothetical protein